MGVTHRAGGSKGSDHCLAAAGQMPQPAPGGDVRLADRATHGAVQLAVGHVEDNEGGAAGEGGERVGVHHHGPTCRQGWTGRSGNLGVWNHCVIVCVVLSFCVRYNVMALFVVLC